ncbi:ribonuclease R [Terasakiella sp. A23]|uniref:ribonuclease R n=1 Tax=Terasakiella sp. FCG-A23 TaxID=3080561 RepID=UPI002953A561|nr:ribonuclease R [Terasakiella sp. A23]MDV7341667.1 ribonuclease R [Terasakiella sp. A23]
MTQKDRKPVPFPTKEQILDFINESPSQVGKREIARAFSLRGPAKIELKKVLKELERDGKIGRGRQRRFATPGSMPDVTVLEITGIDEDGELLATPLSWQGDDRPPKVYVAQSGGRTAYGIRDRVLCRMRKISAKEYEAQVIRQISEAPSRVLGIYQTNGEEGRLIPTDRRAKSEFIIAKENAGDAEDGELVLCEPLPGRVYGLKPARVVERLGDSNQPKAVSLVCIHAHDIPTEFTPAAIEQAETAEAVPLGKRVDLRDIPLVTIDGADARDFDDAVFAEPDTDPKNKGGWHIIVAIADVAHYVRHLDDLDRGAFERGNSVYFPDRVVPMLPEALSNGWCSLVPHEDRGCLAAHMWIDADGHLLRHKFIRGLMRSHARLTYEQAQAARDGQLDEVTEPIMETVINPLYGAYASFLKYREERNVLELDVPERQMRFDDLGNVASIDKRQRLDSHKLIEEFMITANVAAAEALEHKRQPCMYRIHDAPGLEKMEALRQFLWSLDIKLAKGQQPSPKIFNRILSDASKTDQNHMINTIVLRSQAQAEYNPENIGHFGLALNRYAHFTSPIRRYSDLLVHRALIKGYGLGEGGLEESTKDFGEMGDHLSKTERRAAGAERDAMDRYTTLFMADRVGASFGARINGVTRFGLFITLDETGADGLVPIRSLPMDYYDHDEQLHLLRGKRNGLTFRLGERVEAKLMEADVVTGGMVFNLVLKPEDVAKAAKSGGGGRKPRKGHRKGFKKASKSRRRQR